VIVYDELYMAIICIATLCTKIIIQYMELKYIGPSLMFTAPVPLIS